jgi:arsenite-transporting ATPase
VRPVAKRLYDVPLPGDDYFQAIEDLFERLKGVDQLLMNPKITSVRLVTNPEKIVLKETQRAFMYFYLYRMNIDGIIVNRILPEDVEDAYFEEWRESQKRHLEKVEESFSPVPIFHVKLFKDEILGYESLKAFADQIYGERDPLERFFEGEPYRLTKENGEYRLMMRLPFIMKQDVTEQGFRRIDRARGQFQEASFTSQTRGCFKRGEGQAGRGVLVYPFWRGGPWQKRSIKRR